MNSNIYRFTACRLRLVSMCVCVFINESHMSTVTSLPVSSMLCIYELWTPLYILLHALLMLYSITLIALYIHIYIYVSSTSTCSMQGVHLKRVSLKNIMILIVLVQYLIG